MIRKLCSWVMILVVLAGCQESAEPDPDMMGYQYYPLTVGDYRIYHVTNIRTQFDNNDTTRYQLREVVKSSFLDQTNTLNYRIERSVRPNSSSQWMADSVFVVSKSSTNVVLTKDNTKRVKLVFPVKDGKAWLGDAFNDHAVDEIKETYTYTAVGEPFSFEEKGLTYKQTALHFDTTATVFHGEPLMDVATIDERKEVYAFGVGMVYKLFKRAIICTPNNDPLEPVTCGSRIIEGNERHEILIEHGQL